MACYIFELVFLCLDVPVSCRPNQDTVRSNVVFPQVALNPSESKATEFASSSHPFKYHVCAYLRLIFGLRYLGHHLRPISSRTKEIQVLHTLLLAHASTNRHQYTLGCCHNHLNSIKSPSWSIHPSMNWQSHASSVKLGSWTGNRKQHRQKDDKRNGKSKSFLYIKLLLHAKLKSCFLGAGFASFFFSSVGAAFFFGASLLGSFSCKVGGTDRQHTSGQWYLRNKEGKFILFIDVRFCLSWQWATRQLAQHEQSTNMSPKNRQGSSKSAGPSSALLPPWLLLFLSLPSHPLFPSHHSPPSLLQLALRFAWLEPYATT